MVVITAVSAVILGLVQGLTEFLPVSSSGHMVIFETLLGLETPGLVFEVLVHLGTMAAVVVAFWSDIFQLLRRPWHKMVLLIVAGIVPTGLMGCLLDPVFSTAFETLWVVGLALMVTGVLLWWAERRQAGNKNVSTTGIWDALVIGFGQGLAITPGLSRSGTTIAFALLRGLDRETAARYSFLLSVPTILAANLWEARDLLSGQLHLSGSIRLYLLATVVAAVSGFVAIRVFLRLLQRGCLYYFSYYCWLVGLLVLVSAVG